MEIVYTSVPTGTVARAYVALSVVFVTMACPFVDGDPHIRPFLNRDGPSGSSSLGPSVRHCPMLARYMWSTQQHHISSPACVATE